VPLIIDLFTDRFRPAQIVVAVMSASNVTYSVACPKCWRRTTPKLSSPKPASTSRRRSIGTTSNCLRLALYARLRPCLRRHGRGGAEETLQGAR
jgi:hypothetical protein